MTWGASAISLSFAGSPSVEVVINGSLEALPEQDRMHALAVPEFPRSYFKASRQLAAAARVSVCQHPRGDAEFLPRCVRLPACLLAACLSARLHALSGRGGAMAVHTCQITCCGAQGHGS